MQDIGSKSGDAYKVLDVLYSNPVIDASKVSKIIGKTMKTSYQLIYLMEDLEIIKETTGSQRGKVYWFEDYLNLFKG